MVYSKGKKWNIWNEPIDVEFRWNEEGVQKDRTPLHSSQRNKVKVKSPGGCLQPFPLYVPKVKEEREAGWLVRKVQIEFREKRKQKQCTDVCMVKVCQMLSFSCVIYTPRISKKNISKTAQEKYQSCQGYVYRSWHKSFAIYHLTCKSTHENPTGAIKPLNRSTQVAKGLGIQPLFTRRVLQALLSPTAYSRQRHLAAKRDYLTPRPGWTAASEPPEPLIKQHTLRSLPLPLPFFSFA